jgi:hypothetical protein
VAARIWPCGRTSPPARGCVQRVLSHFHCAPSVETTGRTRVQVQQSPLRTPVRRAAGPAELEQHAHRMESVVPTRGCALPAEAVSGNQPGRAGGSPHAVLDAFRAGREARALRCGHRRREAYVPDRAPRTGLAGTGDQGRPMWGNALVSVSRDPRVHTGPWQTGGGWQAIV